MDLPAGRAPALPLSGKDGGVWTTDKDGIIMDLLAAEITAKLRKDPGQLYEELTRTLDRPVYERIDVPTNPLEKAALSGMSADQIRRNTLAGEKDSGKAHPCSGKSGADRWNQNFK